MATLQSLPRLKKLHFNTDIDIAFRKFRSDEAGALDRMKRMLREFLGHVKQLKRTDLQFRFAGFELTKIKLDEIDFDVQVEEEQEIVSEEYIYLKNYHLIEPDALRFIKRVDYGRLVHVTGEFPSCFSKKFTGIEAVRAETEAVQDIRHFCWFLKSLKLLTTLELSCSLGQEFYNQLPAIAPSLAVIRMVAHDPTGGLLGFAFLNGLPRLIEFSISDACNGPLTCDEMISIVSFDVWERIEVYFSFRCKGRNFYVDKSISFADFWTVLTEPEVGEWSEKVLIEDACRTDLLDYLKELPDEISEDDEKSD